VSACPRPLAYAVAVFQHLPEPFWPVMSAIIVARGGSRGGGSASDRLVGTLIGTALGLGASFGRHLMIPDWVLLFLSVTPFAFFSAPAFRAAPMAAMIVLSASAAGSGGHGVAVLRTLDVGLGTAIALFVSYVLLRSDPVRWLRRDAAELLQPPMANLLALAMRGKDPEAREKFVKLNAKVRRDLREIVIAARGIRAKRAEKDLPETPANRFAALLGRTQTTVQFIARALANEDAGIAEALRPFIGAARTRIGALGDGLRANATEPADDLSGPLAESLSRAVAYAAAHPGAHLEALPFLFQTVRDDLAELAEAASGLCGR
jgi:uncharacterized membrane protein YccC